MEKSLARYIWKYTRNQQLWILVVVLVSMYTYFLSFDLPKFIVNGPIQGQGFETPGATQTYFKLTLGLPFVGKVQVFPGIDLTRMESLVYLSCGFLLLVIINGAFKFYINTYKGRLGERMLRRIRFELVDRILRFPTQQFKHVKPAELATMVKDEVEPLGGFIGDAFVQPALLGGQAATALIFIFVQNFWLGAIAAGVVAVQLIIIPKMRKRLLYLGRQRQLTARALSGRISEISEGISTIRSHDTSNLERADISSRLGHIFKIRYDLYQWKFMVKFLNNFLAQVTPFLFYLIGGYQVIKGTLDVGQLVAVIAAYKDLPSPLKDLIDWDQARQDVQIKYTQVYEQFDVENMLDSRIQAIEPGAVQPLQHALEATNLSVTDDSGAKLLDRVSISVKHGETLAIVGNTGGAGEALMEALARVVRPAGGKIVIGERDMHDLPESVTGRRMSYAGSDAYLFQGTLRDNLLYGLKHAPMRPAENDPVSVTRKNWEQDEARKSGNALFDIHADWIDYAAAGATGPQDIVSVMLPLLDAVQLSNDLLELGLRTHTNPVSHPRIADGIVSVRRAFRQRLASEDLGDVVVPFSSGAYNPEATISENILFGSATGPLLTNSELAKNKYFLSVLASAGLTETFYAMGVEIAQNVVELFRDLPPDHPFFQNLAFMSADELPFYQALLKRVQGKTFDALNEEDRTRILALTFPYVEPQHRFGVLTPEIMARIVALREEFLKNLPASLKDSIEPYDPDRYTTAATLLDNVLLGRIAHQHSDEGEHIRRLVREVLAQQGLREDVIDMGLTFNAGVGGRRLNAGLRQKINLVRAILKRPDYLVLNRPLSALDQQEQKAVAVNLLEWSKSIGYKPAVVAVLSTPSLAPMFDRVMLFERGTPVAVGTYDRLLKENEGFKKLMS
jgi:putative ABC transport system ATP-binding protein